MTDSAADTAFLSATTPAERAAAFGLDYAVIQRDARRISVFGVVAGGAFGGVAAVIGMLSGPDGEIPWMPLLIGLLVGLIVPLAAMVALIPIARRGDPILAQVVANVVGWVVLIFFLAVSLPNVQGSEWAFAAGTVIGIVIDTATHAAVPLAFVRGGEKGLANVRANLRLSAFVPVFGGSAMWFVVTVLCSLIGRIAVVGVLDNDPGAIPVWIVLAPILAAAEIFAAGRRQYGGAIAFTVVLAIALVVFAVVLPGSP